MDELCLSSRLTSLADALIRDTLIALFRMTDDPGNNRFTLCAISKLLGSASLQTERVNWFEQCPVPSGEVCKQKINFVLQVVPSKWGAGTKLHDDGLLSLRTELKPIRDKLIAHALPFDGLQLALHRIDDFHTLTGKLVSAAEWIFEGAAPSNRFNPRSRETEEFWYYVVRGFVLEPSSATS